MSGTSQYCAVDSPLPVIDVGGLDGAGRRATAEAIGRTCETIGFMYVANHGVDQNLIDEVQRVTRSFFARPVAYKRSVERRPGTYRGYVTMQPFSEDRESGVAYLYEAFLVGPELDKGDPAGGMRWPNRWPPEFDEFRSAVSAYYDAVTKLSDRLLTAFSLALGLSPDALSARFERPMTNISLLHYPASGRREHPGAPNAREHYDTNALTILLPGEVGGLEVQHRSSGWMEVPPRPGCFVVNIGNMMEAWSGGRFRSTLHRVHPPADRERFSIAYFASPDYDTVAEPLVDVVGSFQASPLHAGREFESFVAKFDPPG